MAETNAAKENGQELKKCTFQNLSLCLVMKQNLCRLLTITILIFFSPGEIFFTPAISLAQSQATRTETTRNYSGIIYGQEPKSVPWQPLLSVSPVQVNMRAINFKFMYPSKSFGWGIEVPYRDIRIFDEKKGKTYHLTGWGDISLVAKYQFGIYHKFQLLNRERLLKAVVSLLAKIKLSTASTNACDEQGTNISPDFQLGSGSKNLVLGLVIHTDTERYFWIHGSMMANFPMTHQNFVPGRVYGSNISFTFARLGINDRIYPFVGLKSWWADHDTWLDKKLTKTGGSFIFLSPGLKSVWHYFFNARLAIMSEVSIQLRLLQRTLTTNSPSFSLYFGTRLFLR